MLTPPLLRFFFNLQLLPIIKNLDLPQVIFIHSENETSINLQTIFKQLSSNIPTLQVNMSNETLKLNQSSALFVWTKDSWTSLDLETQLVRQLRLMTINTYQSKFLILQKDDDNCETLLKLAWAEHLLDFTLLDPHQIHYYNPFINTTTHEPYNTTTTFFPDKLLNLHRYPLKVGIVDYPPYSSVTYHDHGYEYKFVFGQLLHCFSEAANFVVEPDVVTMPGYGVMDGKTGTATGLIGKVWRGEIDLLAFAAFLFFSPFNSKNDRTTYIIIEQGCAVVPIIPLDNPQLLLAGSLQTSFTIILILVVVVWVSSLFLKLDKRLWHPLNVLFLILGISVSNVPKLLRERYVYGCIMIVSLFYSSNIFAQLTNINLATTSFVPFDSYEDLDKSGLLPIIHPNLVNITFGFSDDKFLESLGKKAVPRYDLVYCCPDWVKNNRNVSCVFEGHLAKLQVKLHRDSEGKDVVKMAQPCFWSVSRSFLLPRTSPFTERLNHVIRRVEQAGLHEYWEVQSSFEYKRLQNVSLEDEEGNGIDKGKLKDMLKDDTYQSARVFAVIGSLVSTCVFFGELVIFWFKRWRARAKVFDFTE